jgi:hypothetical protein
MAVTVYEFKELPKKTQEKVLEKHRDINTEMDSWYEFTMDDWKEKLAKKGFEDAKIHFSGFCSQGDGACFDARCDVSRLAKVIYSGKDEGFYREVLQLFADRLNINIEKNSYGYHYNHANTRYVELVISLDDLEKDARKILNTDLLQVPAIISQYENRYDPSEADPRWMSGLVALRLKYSAPAIDLDDLLNKFEKDADELRKDLSNEIYKDLEKEYDYLNSDEAVIETLEANDYEFDEDGDII